MKSMIKYCFVLLSAFSLVACNANKSGEIVIKSLSEGPGVSAEAFNEESNKITEYKRYAKLVANCECRETLVGSWFIAKDKDNNLLPDGTDIYAKAKIIGTTVEKSGIKTEKEGNFPTFCTDQYSSVVLIDRMRNWVDLFNSWKEEVDQENNPRNFDIDNKYYFNPSRMYLKMSTHVIPYDVQFEGDHVRTETFDITFREDGYVDTIVNIITTVADGVINKDAKETHYKCTHTVVEKAKLEYTF